MKRKIQFILKGLILFGLIINLIPAVLNIGIDYKQIIGWLNLLAALIMLLIYLNFRRIIKWRKL